MADAALHNLFGGSRDATGRPPSRSPTPLPDGTDPIASLRHFAAILFGVSPLDPPEDAGEHAVMAQGLAADRLRRAREMPPDRTLRAYPFRTLYLLARERAAAARPAGGVAASKSERALLAMLSLRHRQRAALALRYLFGFADQEVAFVLGLSARGASEVAAAGIAAAARSAGPGLDIAASLRAARAKLLSRQQASAPEPAAALSELDAKPEKRGPRSVVRLLLSAQLAEEKPTVIRSARLMPMGRPRPVYGVLAALRLAVAPAQQQTLPLVVPATEPAALPGTVPGARTHSRAWRTALAAAAVLLLGLMFLPGANRGIPRASPPLAAIPFAPRLAHAVVAPAPPPVSVLYRVRSGDTLWSIAERVLGKPTRWTDVWRANAGHAMAGGGRFIDPNLIQPGWSLTIPKR